MRPTLTDRNPENLTPAQILERIYIYLAHASTNLVGITPEQHKAMLDAIFPAFSGLYLDGAKLVPATGGKRVNLRGEER